MMLSVNLVNSNIKKSFKSKLRRESVKRRKKSVRLKKKRRSWKEKCSNSKKS